MRNNNTLNFDNLSQYENVIHGVSTREFGSMKNEDGMPNGDNIDKFIKSLGLSKRGICMHQVHGANVRVVRSIKDLNIGEADGMVTNIKNISICVLVADCLPVLFFDPVRVAIGVGHGGRRGLQKKIMKNMIEKMESEFASDPEDIIVGIGPGVEKDCYEVYKELMDIRKIAKDQLLEAGVLEKNIEDMNVCTKCNMDKFYSYRGGDEYGRFAGVVCLK